MKRLWNIFCEKFYYNSNKFLERGGGYLLFIFALIAIAFSTVGFYGQMVNGFEWKWFLLFHLPIFIFCGFALYKAMKEYRKIIGKNEK